MIWINVIQVIRGNAYVIQINVIQDYRIFRPNWFNFKIILALIIFENIVASKVLTLDFLLDMPWKSPVGNIRSPADGVKDVSVASLPGPGTLPGTGNMWEWDSNGSR